jgi:hypothetical protein
MMSFKCLLLSSFWMEKTVGHYAWLGWAYLTKKVPSPGPCPSPPPSNSVLDTEKWAPESLTDREVFVFLTRFLHREWCHQSPTRGSKKRFLRVAPGVGQNSPGIFRDALAFFVQIKHKKKS